MTTSIVLPKPKTVEDWLLLITPFVGLVAGFNWGGLVPGASGFLVGVALASLAKTLIGLGQNPHPSNWEDWLSFIVTFLGFLGTALSANPQFIEYGTIIGFLVKSLGFVQSGLNIEDLVLAVGSFLALYGAYVGNLNLASAGLLVGVFGKALPSIGSNGSPTTITVSTPTTP